MLRRPACAALAAAAIATLACQGKGRGPAPERFVPSAVRLALVVPEAGRAAREVADLHAAASAFPGAGEVAGARGAVAAQLGFDPLDPAALADAGVDPRRGAAVAVLDRPGPDGSPGVATIAVLPARSPSRVESLLSRLARDRLGATERRSESRGGVSLTVLRRPGGGGAALAYAVVERTFLVTTHPAGPALVAEAAALAPESSLGGSAAWATAREAVGDAAAIAFAPAGSALLRGAPALRDGVAVGFSAAGTRLSARAAVLLGGREASFLALAADGRPGEIPAVDPAAVLVARWHGDPTALGRKVVPLLPAGVRILLARANVDPQRDLFDALAPGATLAVSLPAAIDALALTPAAVRADPLRLLEFEAILPVRDPGRIVEASGRLTGRAAPRAGEIHRLRTPAGEIAWTVDAGSRRVLVAGGPSGTLEAVSTGGRRAAYRPPTAAARTALGGGLGGAALDPPRLVEAVRRMPAQAFGTGPSGFVMRSLVERLVEPAARLAAVSVRADLAKGALVLTLEAESREGGDAR